MGEKRIIKRILEPKEFIAGYSLHEEKIVERMKKEAGIKAKVVATGGLAGFIAKESVSIDEVSENLTLEGLKIIYEANRDIKR